MQKTNLQLLFNEPIIDAKILDPGYSGHASDVWLVKTATNEAIVRSSRLNREPDHEFWWGCKFLFGIDPRYMIYFEHNAAFLKRISDIPVPEIIARKNINGKEYLIVQKMNGEEPKSFTGQSEDFLQQLGTWLAKVHLQKLNYYGNLARTKMEHQEKFHQKMSQAMMTIVDREHHHNSKIGLCLESILADLSALPAPEYFCPIFIDIGPSQFLTENGRISAVVDIEGYVVGPKEFDFIGLEYVMDENASKPFIKGYETILQLPNLSHCRKVYRYLYRLLGVQGEVDLDTWFAQPVLF